MPQTQFFQIFFFLLFLLIGSASSLYAADLDRGKALFSYCTSCHGDQAQGNETLKAPPIAGQEAWYIVNQLKKFRAGIRGGDPKDEPGLRMRPMARTLADEESMQNVAAYINSLKPASPQSTVVGGDATRGQQHFGVCMACHGVNATGNQAMSAPNLTALSDAYLLRQLKNFKSGIRGSHPQDITGMQMRAMIGGLVDEQAMKDVVAYIRSLQSQ